MTVSKPSILFVLPDLNPGGAQMVLKLLMEGLSSDVFKKKAIVLTGKNRNNSNVPHDYLEKLSTKSALFSLLQYICINKPDVVMTTMSHANFALLMLKPFLPRKTKVIVREASLPLAVVQNNSMKWLNKLLYRFLYPVADCIVSPAQIIIDEFQKEFKHLATLHHLLYNPVPVEEIQKKSLEKTTYERIDGLNFICVGRLNKAKGYDRLLRQLKDFDPKQDWRLTIIGDGSNEERKKLEDVVASCGLQSHIYLGGHQDNPYPFIQRADALLLPSRWEGLPNVVLEALALGTPVIASAEAGGIYEIKQGLQNSLILQISKNMESFVECMRAVKNRDIKAQESFLPDQFKMDYCLRDFSELLQRILSK